MPSIRNVKRRIKSVGSTQQITKAMNLVSAAKLQKSKTKLERTRPFFNETVRVISSIVNSSKGIHHPYLDRREAKNIIVILITGDKGLCGGYNSNISKLANKFAEENKNVSFITLGSKGKDYISRQGKSIKHSLVGISENPFYEDAQEIGEIIINAFKDATVDEVYLAYTEFITTITHEPKLTRILPIDTSKFEDDKSSNNASMIYEPNAEEILDYVIPEYINIVIFGGLIESATCEQGARMTSMDSATENAYEIIDKLTLIYNRARQSAITQEINEIVTGANALS